MRVTPVIDALFWVVILSTVSSHRDDDRYTSGGQHGAAGVNQGVISARCVARCLSLIKSSSAVTSLASCLLNPLCNSCSTPCDRLFTGIDSCKTGCRNTESQNDCIASCQFLNGVKSSRPGTCPSETETVGMATMCIKTCEDDDDCPEGGALKCCNSACGRICQQPTADWRGVPEQPDPPEVRHRVRPRTLGVRWKVLPSTDDTNPIVYVISSRSIVGGDGKELRVLPWRQIAQTTATSVVVTDVQPMTSYQFTVSAVNALGCRGPSKPSKAFFIPQGNQLVDSPTNLTQNDVTFLDGLVSVMVHWLPPKGFSHPVTKYKVTWGERSEDYSSMLSTNSNSEFGFHGNEFKQNVPGNEHSLRIHGLKPDTVYRVQVQGVWQTEKMSRKSDKATAYISTHRFPKPANPVMLPQQLPPSEALQLLVTPPPISSLSVGESYFQNGLLKTNVSWMLEKGGSGGPRNATVDKMLVYWSPETCTFDGPLSNGMAPVMSAITQDFFFVIYDLRFDCQYLIRVQPISSQGVTGSVTQLTIMTPSCRQVSVVGDVRPDCPNSTLRVPEEPPDLEHSFIISGSNIMAQVTWGLPLSDAPISGYQISWNQSPLQWNQSPLQPSPSQAPRDATSGILRIFSKENRTAVISLLCEATTYEVTVQATSKAGLGQKATVLITTPKLQRPQIIGSPHEFPIPNASLVVIRKPTGQDQRPWLLLTTTLTSDSGSFEGQVVSKWPLLAGPCVVIAVCHSVH